jgi:hypothetical protein
MVPKPLLVCPKRIGASAHHRLELTKKTQQDSWSETGMIGSPEEESEGA